MPKIQIMDEALANKIAAGEVVERPASVVKELVENAIDAGAERIEIEIEEGGLSLIRVSDDGEGMDGADLERAFLRHATSKIRSDRDLFRIRTLGFRGEALPSIAAVSKVTAISRTRENWVATCLVIEGGKQKEKKEVSHPQGTEISVRELFYNTPARLKYIKTIQTENHNIQDVIQRLAFAYPRISFIYKNDGKEILKTPGNGDLAAVIRAVYGLDVARKLIPLEGEHLDFEVHGLIAKPEVTRGSRNYITLLVNGRYVRSPLLQKAVLDGYHTLLPVHRYPIAVIHLRMDPGLVDVNVHPAKLEVRFSKEEELAEWLKERIRTALLHHSLIPSAQIRPKDHWPRSEQVDIPFQWNVREPAPSFADQKESKPLLKTDDRKVGKAPDGGQPDGHSLQGLVPPQDPPQLEDDQNDLPDLNGSGDNAVMHAGREILYLEPLAQFHGTYILAQNDKGLYLIDQHAAQERINYERFRNKLGAGVRSRQLLAVPYLFEVTHSESEVLGRSLHLLDELGIGIEPFGERQFIVREIPDWFDKGREEEQIDQIMQMILEGKGRLTLADLRDKSAQLMACKASIKANQHLSRKEMEVLLYQLCQTENPYSCPHGRPVIVHFTLYEIEKLFKRVM